MARARAAPALRWYGRCRCILQAASIRPPRQQHQCASGALRRTAAAASFFQDQCPNPYSCLYGDNYAETTSEAIRNRPPLRSAKALERNKARAFELREQGLTYEKISKTMGRPVATVHVWITNALDDMVTEAARRLMKLELARSAYKRGISPKAVTVWGLPSVAENS
jgi:hypothetical protein